MHSGYSPENSTCHVYWSSWRGSKCYVTNRFKIASNSFCSSFGIFCLRVFMNSKSFFPSFLRLFSIQRYTTFFRTTWKCLFAISSRLFSNTIDHKVNPFKYFAYVLRKVTMGHYGYYGLLWVTMRRLLWGSYFKLGAFASKFFVALLFQKIWFTR